MARFGALRIAILTAGFVLGIGKSASADLACTDVLRMHGLLRKAQGACGFSSYNPAVVARAHACFDAVGGQRGAREMYAGAAQFERMQAIRDSEAVCAAIAGRFPMVVRP